MSFVSVRRRFGSLAVVHDRKHLFRIASLSNITKAYGAIINTSSFRYPYRKEVILQYSSLVSFLTYFRMTTQCHNLDGRSYSIYFNVTNIWINIGQVRKLNSFNSLKEEFGHLIFPEGSTLAWMAIETQ